MRTFIQRTTTFILFAFLSGCTVNANLSQALCFEHDEEDILCSHYKEITPEPFVNPEPKGFNPPVNYQTISEYTEQLVAVLVDKSRGHEFDAPIAVPPFLSFVSETAYSDKLALEIPESIIANLHNEQLQAAEYKLTPPLPDDDLPYASMVKSLKKSQKFGYVLKGTIRQNPHGVTLFVKIIELETEAVIASTAKHLPQYMWNYHS